MQAATAHARRRTGKRPRSGRRPTPASCRSRSAADTCTGPPSPGSQPARGQSRAPAFPDTTATRPAVRLTPPPRKHARGYPAEDERGCDDLPQRQCSSWMRVEHREPHGIHELAEVAGVRDERIAGARRQGQLWHGLAGRPRNQYVTAAAVRPSTKAGSSPARADCTCTCARSETSLLCLTCRS